MSEPFIVDMWAIFDPQGQVILQTLAKSKEASIGIIQPSEDWTALQIVGCKCLEVSVTIKLKTSELRELSNE